MTAVGCCNQGGWLECILTAVRKRINLAAQLYLQVLFSKQKKTDLLNEEFVLSDALHWLEEIARERHRLDPHKTLTAVQECTHIGFLITKLLQVFQG